MSCCSNQRTGLQVKWSTASPNVPYAIAVTGSGTTRTVTITVLSGSSSLEYLFRLWLTDGATESTIETLTPPSGDDTTLWWEATVSGIITKTITHTGAADTWYPQAALVAPIGVGDPLAFT